MKKLDTPEALSQLTKPEHPVLVVSGRIGDKVNVMVAGWVMRTSFSPPLAALSVGRARYTHGLLSKYDEFVLCYPSGGQERIISFCGSRSGRDTDKIKEIGIPTLRASAVRLPLIDGSRVCFECRKTAELETGDHTLFVGEVLASSGDPGKNPLINLGNYAYAEFSPETPS